MSNSIHLQQIDITDSLTTNNFNKYITMSKNDRKLILAAHSTSFSRPLFVLHGSCHRMFIYQGAVYPDLDEGETLEVVVPSNEQITCVDELCSPNVQQYHPERKSRRLAEWGWLRGLKIH